MLCLSRHGHQWDHGDQGDLCWGTIWASNWKGTKGYSVDGGGGDGDDDGLRGFPLALENCPLMDDGDTSNIKEAGLRYIPLHNLQPTQAVGSPDAHFVIPPAPQLLQEFDSM